MSANPDYRIRITANIANSTPTPTPTPAPEPAMLAGASSIQADVENQAGKKDNSCNNCIATLDVIAYLIFGIILSAITLSTIVLVTWGPYIIWSRVEDPFVIATLMTTFALLSMSTKFDDEIQYARVYNFTTTILLRLAAPSAMYGLYYCATNDEKYNNINGNILIAYGVISTLFSILNISISVIDS